MPSTIRGTDNFNSAVTGLGYNQTWQDVSASRSVGVTYQNTTGKPIEISVSRYGGDNGESYLYIDTVNPPNVIVAQTYQLGAAVRSQLTAIVPNGHYYRVTGDGISRWSELR